MTRNLKALGLSLVAMVALGALGASSASAVDKVTTGNGEPAILTGVSHNGLLTLTGASGEVITRFECTTAKLAATVKTGMKRSQPTPCTKAQSTKHRTR